MFKKKNKLTEIYDAKSKLKCTSSCFFSLQSTLTCLKTVGYKYALHVNIVIIICRKIDKHQCIL